MQLGEQALIILLVEDAPNIIEPLIFGLQQEGFRMLQATYGLQGLRIARAEHIDLVLLDVILLGMDGFTLCRMLRWESAVPIIMLTALRRRAPDHGAPSVSSDQLKAGEIMLDQAARRVWCRGRPVELAQWEFDLLRVLMENAGKAMSRHEWRIQGGEAILPRLSHSQLHNS